jgi:DNA polymerase-3 subunit gamma/tau
MLTAEVTADVLGIADRRLLVELARAALERDAGTALRLLARAADRGVDFGELGRSFLGFLRDLEVIARVGGGGSVEKTGGVDLGDLVDATPEEIEEARALAARATPGLFPVMFDRWARAVDEASRLPTPRLLFEMAALDLCSAEPMIPLGDLLQRLDELEARLRGAPRAPAAPAPSTPPAPAGAGSRPKSSSGQRSWAAPEADAPEAPAPAPAASPSRAPAAPEAESAAEAWRRVMAAFEARGPRLAALLAHAEVVSLAAAEVTLAFGSKQEADRAEKARAEIEQVTAATMGRPVQVSFRVGTPAAAVLRSEVGTETDAANVDRQNREAEARQHPVIRRAQDVFGASLKEIKTP